MSRLVMQQVLLGSASLWEILFGKANHALLLVAEEIYGSSPRRSELFLHLRYRIGKRRLRNFIAVQTLISESQIS